MNYRRATVTDAEGIAQVHIAAWRTTYAGLVPVDFLNNLSIERRTERWRQLLAEPEPGEFMFVAEQDGALVGFASGGPEREDDPGYHGELYTIYLSKEAQGRGAGRQLVNLAAQALLDQGLTSMLVWVLAENPARKFYEALGGQYLREKPIEIGGANLIEVAYGWDDISALAHVPEEK